MNHMVEDTNLHNDNAAEALSASLNRYQSLLDAVNGIIWEVDAHTYTPTFISNSVTRILGYTPEEWMNTADFWEHHIYHEDREGILAFYHEAHLKQNHNLSYRMVRADGEIIWVRDIVSVVMEDGKPRWLRGIMIDVTESKLLVDLEHLEKEVLELNSKTDTDIEAVLNFYVLGIEKLFPKMKCSILSVNETKLNDWVSPSLPEAYSKYIHNIEIGPYAGSCGAAAYLKRPVFVTDIEHDEIWAAHKDVALENNLRASWSYPIVNRQGDVVAIVGIYYEKVTPPDDNQTAIIDRSVNILTIILENRSYAAMMRHANMLISQGQALANFGTWQWDIVTNKVSWSDVLYNIYGLDPASFNATFEGYLERIHPEDRDRVAGTIKGMLGTGGDAVFEERIVRPDGEVRHLKSWAKIIGNNGKGEKMIGACLDITDAKTTATKMDEIAWLQSHVIRAPLATLMGLITVLHEDLHEADEHADLLNSIVATARELDRVIHEISDKTRT